MNLLRCILLQPGQPATEAHLSELDVYRYVHAYVSCIPLGSEHAVIVAQDREELPVNRSLGGHQLRGPAVVLRRSGSLWCSLTDADVGWWLLTLQEASEHE